MLLINLLGVIHTLNSCFKQSYIQNKKNYIVLCFIKVIIKILYVALFEMNA